MLLETSQNSDLSITEQDSFSISQAALSLDQARAKDDLRLLASALDHNLELWVRIRTIVSQPNVCVSENVQDNLTKLANYVADATMSHGIKIPEKILDTLININLQISEGLLEGSLSIDTRKLS